MPSPTQQQLNQEKYGMYENKRGTCGDRHGAHKGGIYARLINTVCTLSVEVYIVADVVLIGVALVVFCVEGII